MGIDNANLKRIGLLERQTEFLIERLESIENALDQLINRTMVTDQQVPISNRIIINEASVYKHNYCDKCNTYGPLERKHPPHVCEYSDCLYGNSIGRDQK